MSALNAAEQKKLNGLIARRDALFANGMDPAEDLGSMDAFAAMVLDTSVSFTDMLEALERHVEKLEARRPHAN